MRSARAEIERVQRDPAASGWLKTALNLAMGRDPVDAANDAETLSKLIVAWADEVAAEEHWEAECDPGALDDYYERREG